MTRFNQPASQPLPMEIPTPVEVPSSIARDYDLGYINWAQAETKARAASGLLIKTASQTPATESYAQPSRQPISRH